MDKSESYFFFQWLAYIKYEWFLQELEMACVFAIKISIYIVCLGKNMFCQVETEVVAVLKCHVLSVQLWNAPLSMTIMS